MASRRKVLWLLVPALAALSTSAWADPTPQQKELARDLMQKGYAARNAHDLKVALESFRGADEIMHVPTTGFERARSLLDLGQLVEAHEMLLSVLRLPQTPAESPAFREARGYAKQLEEEIAPRIPQLLITVSGAAPGRTPTVAVDGTTLPEGALLVPYKVDPGHHVVSAKTDGAAGSAEVDVGERANKDVTVVLSPAPSAATAPIATGSPASPGAAAPPPSAPEAEPSRSHSLGPLAWTGFGVAAAGLAVGSVTGLIAIGDKSSIASQCNGTRCPPSTYGALSSADTVATLSTIAFVVAGVGAGVGFGAWLLGSAPSSPAPSASAASTGVRAAVYVGPGTLGARGTF